MMPRANHNSIKNCCLFLPVSLGHHLPLPHHRKVRAFFNLGDQGLKGNKRKRSVGVCKADQEV